MKIEIADGKIVELKPITGRMGAIHFSILTKAIPSVQIPEGASEEDIEAMKKKPMSPEDMEKMTDAFVEWTGKVLPNIIIGGKPEYDKLTGEEQFGIFTAIVETMNVESATGESFRVIQ